MSDTGFQLAQVTIGRLAAPLESAQLADFVAGLEPVYSAAEAAPGFIWRRNDDAAEEEPGNPPVFGDPMIIVNLSVWTDHQSLWDFVYGLEHRILLRRRHEFFEPMMQANTALWWIPAGHKPTVVEARGRLHHLRGHGATDYAFGLTDSHFTAPAH